MSTLTAGSPERPLSEIFADEGLITPEDLSEILGARTDTTESLGDLLVRLGRISEKDRIRCVGIARGIEFIDLTKVEVPASVARLIPHGMAQRLHAIPVERRGPTLAVAMVNPLDITAIDEIQSAAGMEIDPLIATEDDIKEAILRSFGAGDDMSDLIDEAIKGVDITDFEMEEAEPEPTEVGLCDLDKLDTGAPVVRLVSAIISKAISGRASDIHIEPEARRVRVRYRVDGIMHEVMSVPKDLRLALTSRIKVLGNMDIAEKRAPQDGRITMVAQGEHYDFRISTYPSIYGENLVIRVLDKSNARIGLERLGLAEAEFQELSALVERPYGMILACGPTGCGKTTTLYAVLNALNSVERNIITVEDPVEYQLPGVIQGNVNPKAGVTFASGLRTIVRQDPDVVLVGEIRDGETAQIAIEAALTGHLLLSTIHSNDSAGAISRLVDMGIEPFLVASALIGVSAQRLVRTVCPKCSEPYEPPETVLNMLGLPSAGEDDPYIRGKGCEHCSRTGYWGRLGIFEVLVADSQIESLIMANASSADIRQYAAEKGMRTLRESALAKVAERVTTPEEALRVTNL